MTGRVYQATGTGKYRYGFNGQEKDDEIYGEGSATSAEFWEYDARLGRRWNIDPKPNPSISVYACFANNPIMFKDQPGDTIVISFIAPNSKGNQALKLVTNDLVQTQANDNVFMVVAHGSTDVLQGDSKNGSITYSTPEAIFNELMLNDDFKKAYNSSKGEIKIILLACNTATEKADGTDPIASELSKLDPRFVVTGLSGFGVISKVDSKEKTDIGRKGKFGLNGIVGSWRGNKYVDDSKLGLITFKGGKIIDRIPFLNKKTTDKTETTKPIPRKK